MDLALFRALNGLAGRWIVADEFFRLVANDYVVPTVIVSLLLVRWFRDEPHHRRVVVHAIVALLLANLLVKGLNLLWFRPRPFTYNEVTLLFYFPSDSSFPSNSAAAVWSLAAALWFRDRAGTTGRVALGLAALMGLGRIWIGVHYPLDIVGGAAIGLLAAAVVEQQRRRLRPLTDGLYALASRLALA